MSVSASLIVGIVPLPFTLWAADSSSVPSTRTHPISVHGGNFHYFQWELSEYEIQDFDGVFEPANCVDSALLAGDYSSSTVSLSIYFTSVLIVVQKNTAMIAVIPYLRLEPCEQSAAELRQHNCDFQYARSP